MDQTQATLDEPEYDLIELSEPQAHFIASNKPRNLYLAGSGAGKSHGGGVISGRFIKNFPKIRGFIGANTYDQLSKSTLDRIFKVWAKSFGMIKDVHFVVDKQPPAHYKVYGQRLKDYNNVISFINGHVIFVSSLENYRTIDGTEFSYAILDETKDTKEEAVKEVITFRLREAGMWIDENGDVFDYKPEGWSESFNPLYILTSPAKVQWINEWFELDQHYEEIALKIFSETEFYTLEGKSFSVVISSTFHNRHNLSDGFIEKTIDSLAGSPHLIEMNIYGSPIAKSGGEFIHQFKRLEHVKPVKYKEGLPTHLSLDFNVRPYMTGLVAQVEKMPDGVTEVRFIKEYCLSNPKNKTESICEAWISDFGAKNYGLFYYGDPSGGNEQTLSRDYRDNYDLLAKKLRPYLNNLSNRVLRTHPSVLLSRDFLNNIFANVYKIRIIIDPSCKELIADLEFCKEDANGKMIKPKKKDENGMSYEPRGHVLDSKRYLLVALFPDIMRTIRE